MAISVQTILSSNLPLGYTGSQGVIGYTGSTGVARAEVSQTAPVSPGPGELWYESDSGKLSIYYENGANNSVYVGPNYGVKNLTDFTSVISGGTASTVYWSPIHLKCGGA